MGKPAQRSRDRGSDDEEPEDHEGSEPRAGAVASAQAVEPAPVREPVDLDVVDPAEAVAVAREAIGVGAAIAGDVDAYTFQQLIGPVVERIRSGAAVEGIGLGEVCEDALVGRGRIAANYTPGWLVAAELAVRYIIARAGRQVLYEELYTVPARTGRDHQGFGTHHNTQASHVVHFAGVALAVADRHCPAAGIQLTTGTRDDPSSEDADPARIAAFAEELGHRVPGPLSEHLRDVLIGQREVRAAVTRAADLDAIFAPLPIDKHKFAKAGFAQTVYLDALPFGPSTRRLRSSSGVALPGLDPEVRDILERSGRPAIAFAGDLAPADINGTFQPVAWEECGLSDALGVPRTQPYGVEMLWSPRERLLVRRDLGAGASARGWRLIGTAANDLPTSTAIVDRSLQDWPAAYLGDAVRRCGPGFLKSQQIASQAAWRALLRIADAALVDADRRTRARHAHG